MQQLRSIRLHTAVTAVATRQLVPPLLVRATKHNTHLAQYGRSILASHTRLSLYCGLARL
jgi:hypothetical protein